MSEEKYFIYNEFGEAVRVTKEEYDEFVKLHPEYGTMEAPIFQTPEMQESRKKQIDQVIKDLNEEELTSEQMAEIAKRVREQNSSEKGAQNEEDIEKENRERLDDDLKSFNTDPQLDSISGKDAQIQRIVNMLNQLKLAEDELLRIEKEVERISEEEEEKKEEKKEAARKLEGEQNQQ